MPTRCATFIVAALAVCGTPRAVSAAPVQFGFAFPNLPQSASLREGAAVLAPLSFARFCLDYPSQCASDGSSAIELTPERWAVLNAVNARVNAQIRPAADNPGEDRWELDRSQGDCDEYAVQKRHDLIARGFPAAALSLAVVRLRSREAHLVLVARTNRGDFVLDNLRRGVLPWTATGYRFRQMQSMANPLVWVESMGVMHLADARPGARGGVAGVNAGRRSARGGRTAPRYAVATQVAMRPTPPRIAAEWRL
jgi:predicted transglutaminase-like cysteine proteinase